APGGPEIDPDRLALELGQLHGGAVDRLQGKVGGGATQPGGRGGAAGREREDRQGGRAEGAPPGLAGGRRAWRPHSTKPQLKYCGKRRNSPVTMRTPTAIRNRPLTTSTMPK